MKLINEYKRINHSILRRIKIKWYKLRYNIIIRHDESMLPSLGKGKYISVLQKGNFLDITDSSSTEFIRLIPYKPNHGIMVEFHKNGKVNLRASMDLKFFKKYVKKLTFLIGLTEGTEDSPVENN